MSPLTNHTTGLQLSLALKEAGWPQESLFYWSIPNPEKADNEKERLVLVNSCEVELCHKWTDWGDKFDKVAAPTASELIDVLPYRIDDYFLEIGKMDNEAYEVWYRAIDDSSIGYRKEGKSLPSALAKLVLYLVKEGMMKF